MHTRSIAVIALCAAVSAALYGLSEKQQTATSMVLMTRKRSAVRSARNLIRCFKCVVEIEAARPRDGVRDTAFFSPSAIALMAAWNGCTSLLRAEWSLIWNTATGEVASPMAALGAPWLSSGVSSGRLFGSLGVFFIVTGSVVDVFKVADTNETSSSESAC